MQEAFGDFKVLERVGAGSKAETYRARDTRAGRTVAIKVLTSDLAMDPVAGAPFVDDAYLAQKLGHPNAATLYDIGEQDGRPHLVYEFIQGQTLTALLAGQPINPRRALELATQIADALADAHALGLVHRGLRPEKVIVSLKGNAKVLDFGLGYYATAVTSQLAGAGGASAVTAQRLQSYWAPEQWQATADPRSDLYALGLLLLEMLTGRAPRVGGAAPRVSEVSSAPPLAQPLLRRLLSEDPAQRPESAATVAAELRQLVVVLEAQRDAPRESPSPVPVAAAPPPPPASVPSTPSPRTAVATAAPPAPAASSAAPSSTTARPAAAAPGRKANSGVTVTSAPPPAAPAAQASATSAKPAAAVARKGGQKGRATRPAGLPARPAPSPAPDHTVNLSGLGKTAGVMVAAVLLLLVILYFVFD